jgi:predicted ATP-binding protein involved in virulence
MQSERPHRAPTRVVMNESGAVVARHDYRAYGEEISKFQVGENARDMFALVFTWLQSCVGISGLNHYPDNNLAEQASGIVLLIIC